MSYLAHHPGVSIQQVINYETGAHRVSAGQLFQIAFAGRRGDRSRGFYRQTEDEAQVADPTLNLAHIPTIEVR